MSGTTPSNPADRPAVRKGQDLLPRATVYIAALPRSGSTMLANLLSSPPDHWVLVEPGLHRAQPSPNLRNQLDRFVSAAAPAASEAPPAAPTAAGRRLLFKQLADLLPTLGAWGVKEVDTDHRDAIAYLRPTKTIVLVRDIRDALLSLLEKQSMFGRHWSPAGYMEYLRDCCTALISLAGDQDPNTRVCRYEDLVSSPGERQALADWLSWPLDGDISRNLDLYRREYEVARHDGTITARSVGRHTRDANDTRAEIARQFGALLEDFHRTFGYRVELGD